MEKTTRNLKQRLFFVIALASILFAVTMVQTSCKVSFAKERKSKTTYGNVKSSAVGDSLSGVPTHTPDGFEIPPYVRGQIKKYNAMLLSHDDVTLCDQATYLSTAKKGCPVVCIEAGELETRITTAIYIGWNWNWGFTDKGTSLVDPATGDRYMIRGVDDKTELGRLFYYPYTLKGQAVLKTMIFPPLKKEVTTVDIVYPGNKIDVPAKDNGTERYVPGVVIADYPPVEKPKGEVIK